MLFSGGKDSTLALIKAMKEHEVVCLVTVISENPYSYMFHTANIHVTELQAECLGLPLRVFKTKGEKEIELDDLKRAIKEAQKEFRLDGVVTGALKSVYQASRIQKICDELRLVCYNPLWQMDQVQLLNEVVGSGMQVIISGVFAEPLGRDFLGKLIDEKMVEKLKKIAETHKINPAGEGGEIETTVLDCAIFKKRIVVKKSKTEYKDFVGVYKIEDAVLEPK